MWKRAASVLTHRSAHSFAGVQSKPIIADKGKWDLFVGVQVERLPVISKTLNTLENDYQDSLTQIEFENSHKSEFEIQHEKDVKTSELLKGGKLRVDLDAVTALTTSDLKDMWLDELSKFQLALRRTGADDKDDLRSTDRKLENALTLLVEQKLGNEQLLLLPQGKINREETLYQAAQRIIQEHCGKNLQAHIYGNAPCGFFKYKYPKEMRDEIIGAKVFFYRAVWIGGQVDAKSKNFLWLDKTELFEKINKHRAYKKCLSQFII